MLWQLSPSQLQLRESCVGSHGNGTGLTLVLLLLPIPSGHVWNLPTISRSTGTVKIAGGWGRWVCTQASGGGVGGCAPRQVGG